MLLLAQRAAVSTPGVAHLLSEIHWFGLSVNQIAFHQLSHFDFQPVKSVKQHLVRIFSTLGTAEFTDKHLDATGDMSELSSELAERTSANALYYLMSQGAPLPNGGVPWSTRPTTDGPGGCGSSDLKYTSADHALKLHAALTKLASTNAETTPPPTRDVSSC